MQGRFSALMFSAIFAISAFAQQNDRPPSTGEITEPTLITVQAPAPPQNCKKKHREEVDFDVLINSAGFPAQYYFRTVRGDEADLMALRTVAADRFSPAKRGGAAIQVKRTVAVNMELCIEKRKESDGAKTELLAFAAPPDQRVLRPADLSTGELDIQSPVSDSGGAYKVGGRISQPTPLLTPEAIYTDEARKARKQGDCFVKLIVDSHGIPVNPQVVRSLGMGLDERAVNAVQHYRFKPAMKDGQIAVPVLITVKVSFHLY
jgi:TonB family protein